MAAPIVVGGGELRVVPDRGVEVGERAVEILLEDVPESARHQRLRAGHGLGPARLDDRGAMGDAVGRGELRRVAGPPGIIEGRGQGCGARSNGCCCGHREGQEADGDTAKHGKAKIVTPGTHGCSVAGLTGSTPRPIGRGPVTKSSHGNGRNRVTGSKEPENEG